MRPPDANARASVRSPSGRTHAATVTSLLGTPGSSPGTDGDAHATRCRLCGRARSTLRHSSRRRARSPRAQDAYIRSRDFDRPTVIFDLEMLRAKYRALEAGLGDATIHYAVKANPAPEVVAALAALGGRFDCASRGEIDLCLGLGVAGGPHRLRQHHQARRRHRPCPRRWASSSSPSTPRRRSARSPRTPPARG